MAQVAPPSVVDTTAAPLGAPAVPTVEPTAQQRSGVTQSTASRELTGEGSVTAVRPPSHGDPGAMVDTLLVAGPELLPPQAAASTPTRATDNQTQVRAQPDRGGVGHPWPEVVVVTAREMVISGP